MAEQKKFLDGDGLKYAWNLARTRGAKIAGFMYDSNNFSSGVCTRITTENDPLDLVNFVPTVEATAALGGSGGYSEFDNFPAIVTEQVTLDTGDVMVKLPTSWCRLHVEGSKRYYYIGDKNFEGSYIAPWSGRYIGRYNTNGSSSPVSQTGKTPTGNVSITDFRTYAQNKGTGWGIMDWAEWSFIQYGILLEYLSADSRGVIGGGYNSANNTTGGTDSMSFHTGTMATDRSGTGAVQYRYIECPWGNNATWCDGVFTIGGNVHMSTDPSGYSSKIAAGESLAQYTAFLEGTLKGTLALVEKPWMTGFPSFIDSSDLSWSSHFFSEGYLYYDSAATVQPLYVGAFSSSYSGAFCFCAISHSVSDSSTGIGSRLSYIPI